MGSSVEDRKRYRGMEKWRRDQYEELLQLTGSLQKVSNVEEVNSNTLTHQPKHNVKHLQGNAEHLNKSQIKPEKCAID